MECLRLRAIDEIFDLSTYRFHSVSCSNDMMPTTRAVACFMLRSWGMKSGPAASSVADTRICPLGITCVIGLESGTCDDGGTSSLWKLPIKAGTNS